MTSLDIVALINTESINPKWLARISLHALFKKVAEILSNSYWTFLQKDFVVVIVLSPPL